MERADPPPADFDDAADCIASYYVAITELRRRYLAGEPMPEGWRPDTET